MQQIDVILNAFMIGDHYFRTDGASLVKEKVPDNIAYFQTAGGAEWFTTSSGWQEMVERDVSFDEWQRNFRYPFSYLTHLFIKRPELVRTGALGRRPRIMYLDIECASDGSGRFPRAELDPMIMFGYAIDDGEIKVHYIKDYDKRPIGMQDLELMKEFMDVMEKEDPDIIVTYNGYSFDIPYIAIRAKILDIDIYPLLRLPSDLPERDRVKDMDLYLERLNANLGSRLHYDIFAVDVMRDQKLSGIKDRKMKTVGKHFLKEIADDIIELEDGISNTLEMLRDPVKRQKLIDYQKSDVIVTRGLAKIYLPLSITAANELGLPLGIIINRSNGTLATVYTLKRLLEERILPDKGNDDLFPEMYELIKNNKTIDRNIKKSFQGAYVDLYKTGRFEKLWKLDFSSLYPSIIILFNLSYETVSFNYKEMIRLTGEREESWRLFTKEREQHLLKLGIPDASYMRILNVEVDQGHRGIMPRVLAEGLATRKAIRTEMKGLDPKDPKYAALDSQQNITKVINNSIFGILSNRFSIGYLPVGFTITGLGRYLIRRAIGIISDPSSGVCKDLKTKGEPWTAEWKNTNPVVEIDTDGILINAEPVHRVLENGTLDPYAINNALTKAIEDDFGIRNDGILRMEMEEFGQGYIKAMKNYILIDLHKKDPIIHGSFFKSSRAAPVVDRAVKLLIDHLLYQRISADDVRAKALDLSWANNEDYKQKVRMSKSIKSYKSRGDKHEIKVGDTVSIIEEKSENADNQMLVRLATMYKESYGYTPQKGDIMEFVAVREITTGKKVYIPYNKIFNSSIYKLDHEYYLDTIREMLEPVGVPVTNTSHLMDIMEDI